MANVAFQGGFGQGMALANEQDQNDRKIALAQTEQIGKQMEMLADNVVNLVKNAPDPSGIPRQTIDTMDRTAKDLAAAVSKLPGLRGSQESQSLGPLLYQAFQAKIKGALTSGQQATQQANAAVTKAGIVSQAAGGTPEDQQYAKSKLLGVDPLDRQNTQSQIDLRTAQAAAAGVRERTPFKLAPDEIAFDAQGNEIARGGRKTREMSVTDVGKLDKDANLFQEARSAIDGFQDKYAGYTVPGSGELALQAGLRGVPGGMDKDAVSFWQRYQKSKNVVRNELFGSALTPPERAEFEKSDINPSMDPAIIKENLAAQKQIVENGVRRKAKALAAEGFRKETIAKGFGISVADIDKDVVDYVPKKSGPMKKLTKQADIDALQPGEKYVDATGKTVTKPGARAAKPEGQLPPPAAVELLNQNRSDPEVVRQFEQKYGVPAAQFLR